MSATLEESDSAAALGSAVAGATTHAGEPTAGETLGLVMPLSRSPKKGVEPSTLLDAVGDTHDVAKMAGEAALRKFEAEVCKSEWGELVGKVPKD